MEQEIKVVEVKIGDEVRKVEVRKPTPKIEAEGNMAASKVFAKLVKEKGDDGKAAFILRSQLNSYLANIGIYSEEDIEDITTFGNRIEELQEILSKGGKKKSEGRDAAVELRRLRYAVYALLSRQTEFDKNTVEHYADNARMDYLVTKCICFEGGAPIFKNVSDYENDSVLQSALAEPIQILAGIVSSFDPDFEKNLPENKFLIKYNFCDEKYRLINKEGKLIDGDGNLVDDDGNRLEKVDKPEAVGEFLDDEDDLVSSEAQVGIVPTNEPVLVDVHGNYVIGVDPAETRPDDDVLVPQPVDETLVLDGMVADEIRVGSVSDDLSVN